MKIGERAGAINLMSRLVAPFFSRLFPEVPAKHPAYGHMMMNFSANLLGLDNAATPFGLKAMESLQELNPDKDKASNAQIMFLVLHASGLTLIPISIIAMRASVNPPAANPTDIFIPCMIATAAATIAALIIVSIKQKINLLQPVVLGWILGISGIVGLLIAYLNEKKDFFSNETFEHLLINEKGRALNPRYVQTVVKKYLQLVTTIEKKSPHVLRHSFATHLMNNGAELNAVKELLGHSSLAATQIYTHNTIEKLKDIHAKAHPKA
jgi:spore maturation protein SpmA